MMRAILYSTVNVTPFVPAPREYCGNMCGVRVPDLEPVPRGAGDPSLVLSWFIDRYTPTSRQRIYAAWHLAGCVDVLVSWPDSQNFGYTPQQFVATCHELIAAGFVPCVMLSAKPTSSADVRTEQETLANILLVLPLLIQAGVAPRICIGWELSLWLTPADVQMLTDAIAPLCTPSGIKVYVHFQGGYFAFEVDGGNTADYWWLQIGKLTGILHQRDFNEDGGRQSEYQARIVDCLERFAGGFGFPTDSGFGHPFDFIALEITAELQFQGAMDEATGNSWGTCALTTPPSGNVRVQGSGNGQE